METQLESYLTVLRMVRHDSGKVSGAYGDEKCVALEKKGRKDREQKK